VCNTACHRALVAARPDRGQGSADHQRVTAVNESIWDRYRAQHPRPLPFLVVRDARLLVTPWLKRPPGIRSDARRPQPARWPSEEEELAGVIARVRALWVWLPPIAWIGPDWMEACEPEDPEAWIGRRLFDYRAVAVLAPSVRRVRAAA